MGIHIEIKSLHLQQCISNASHFNTSSTKVWKANYTPNTAVSAKSISKNKQHKQSKKYKTMNTKKKRKGKS